MIGSAFEGGIQAGGLQVDSSLFLSGGAAVRGGALELTGAKVGDSLDMNGSKFESKIIAERLRVGGHLLLYDATFAQSPDITFGHIGGGAPHWRRDAARSGPLQHSGCQ
jgi:hypothetical protein